MATREIRSWSVADSQELYQIDSWGSGYFSVNEAGNVVGLMPHPEYAVDPLLGSDDGAPLLRSFLHAAEAHV